MPIFVYHIDPASESARTAGRGSKRRGARGWATPTFQKTLRQLLDLFLHPGAPPTNLLDNEERIPALLLLYHVGSGDTSGPDQSLVRALLDHGAKVNDHDVDGMSPLAYAATYSNCGAVRLLLVRGADIESKNREGGTPLMGARAEGTKILLEHGSNVETLDNNGQTPLMLAVSSVRPDVVRLLLEHGASITRRDAQGLSLFDSARIRRIFLEAIAKQFQKVTNPHHIRSDAREIESILRSYGAK